MNTSKTINCLGIAIMVFCMTCGCHKSNSTVSEHKVLLTKSQQDMVASAGNATGVKLLGDFCNAFEDYDILYSPYGLALDLSLLSLGTEGESKAGLMEFLGYEGCDEKEIADLFAALTANMGKEDALCTFSSAFSTWCDSRYKFNEDFSKLAKESFSSDIFEAYSFADNSTVSAMNSWSKNKTSGEIDDVIDKLNEDDLFVLLNSIYFKGAWTNSMTKKELSDTFKHHDGTETTVKDWVCADRNFEYAASDNAGTIKIPFGNGSYSFVITLPDVSINFNAYVSELLAGELDGINNWENKEICLRMPAYKAKFNSDMSAILLETELSALFENDEVTLISGTMTRVNRILQSSSITVDEKGAVAASSTAIIGGVTDVGPGTGKIDFIADHPFIYGIREENTGMYLFLGVKR